MEGRRVRGSFGIMFMRAYTQKNWVHATLSKLCIDSGEREQKLGTSFPRDYFEDQKDVCNLSFPIPH